MVVGKLQADGALTRFSEEAGSRERRALKPGTSSATGNVQTHPEFLKRSDVSTTRDLLSLTLSNLLRIKN
jgi:hypothetical protein